MVALLPGTEQAQFLKYAIYFAMGGASLLYREQRIGQLAMFGVLTVMSVVATLELGWLPTALAVATALIIAFVPLRNPLFVFLGTISYSLYLTHILIASSAEFLLVRFFSLATAAERLAAQFACLALGILGACVFYWLVERRFVDLSQRLGNPRDRGQRPATNEGALPSEGL